MNLMFQPLRKFADFSGRARRSEYWLFMLFQFVLYLVVIGIAVVGGLSGGGDGTALVSVLGSVGIIGLLVLAFTVPNLAVMARRVHDLNLSAWWLCLMVPGIVAQFTGSTLPVNNALTDLAGIPVRTPSTGGMILGVIALLCNLALFVMTVLPGTRGNNKFGPDPKGGSIDISVFDDERVDAAITEAKAAKSRDPDYKPVFDFTSPLPTIPSSEPVAPRPAPVAVPATRAAPSFGKRR